MKAALAWRGERNGKATVSQVWVRVGVAGMVRPGFAVHSFEMQC